jgi:glucose/arabinose dehydrogenase
VLLLAGSARAGSLALQLTQVGPDFDRPIYVTSTPADPTALYVVERGGRIYRMAGGVVGRKPFLNIRGKVSLGGERGLLSMAFSPNYGVDGLFYVYYTDKKGTITVAQYHVKPGKKPAHPRIVLRVPHPQFDNHNGGQLQFGPDGDLYAGTGDGGSGGDPNNNAQNPDSGLGKLWRASPSNWVWEKAGYGLRNPWRFSFDSANGDLYIADVGQGSWEEVDYRAQSDLLTPANYGWSRYEGTHDFNVDITIDPGSPTPLVSPVYEYDHSSGRCAIMGGYVYRGSAMPDRVGRYFFGDYCTGEIWTMDAVTGANVALEANDVPGLVSFGVDQSHELYAVSEDGPVYSISE